MILIILFYFLFNHKNNLKLSSIGIDYLVINYIKKSYQKVSLILLKNNSNTKNINQNDIKLNENKLIQKVKKSLIYKLVKFNRCHQILSLINNNLNNKDYNKINLFLFPDILIKDNNYYHYLLFYSSQICFENTLNFNNEEAKLYLANLEA
jgi:hypothetical protein